MISRGRARILVEFVGGVVLATSFILMFAFFGVVNVLILIPIFWFVATPIVEVIIGKIYKALYRKSDERMSRKFNVSADKIRKEVYEYMDMNEDVFIKKIVDDMKIGQGINKEKLRGFMRKTKEDEEVKGMDNTTKEHLQQLFVTALHEAADELREEDLEKLWERSKKNIEEK